MTKRLLIALLALAPILASGCLFSKKARKPAENPAIAGEVADTFQRRWVDKRTAELTAQGSGAEAARTQANAEFREKFEYAVPAKK